MMIVAGLRQQHDIIATGNNHIGLSTIYLSVYRLMGPVRDPFERFRSGGLARNYYNDPIISAP